MSPEEAHGVLDEAIRQLVVLHEAVLDAQLHARLGHRDEVDQRAFDALVAIRGLDREIRMNVLPRIEHIRGELRKARKEAAVGGWWRRSC